jgi:hypothetical protein
MGQYVKPAICDSEPLGLHTWNVANHRLHGQAEGMPNPRVLRVVEL